MAITQNNNNNNNNRISIPPSVVTSDWSLIMSHSHHSIKFYKDVINSFE